MSRRKTSLIAGAVLLLICTFFSKMHGDSLGIDIAHAQGVANPSLDSVVSGIAWMAGVAITFMNFLMWAIFVMLDLLLDPNLIFGLTGGSSGDLIDILHTIWQLSRDLVNITFIFVLIGAAIMTIVKADTAILSGKNIAKFIIALVLVNFSWFIPQVIFDISQVVTATVYDIPSMLSNGDSKKICTVKDDQGNEQPCEVIQEVRFLDKTNGLTNGQTTNDGKGSWKCPIAGLVCYRYKSFDEDTETGMPSKIMNGLVINYANLRNLTSPSTMNGPAPVGITATITFLIKMLVVLAIHIALFFPMLAMAIAFLIRIPILWITMAFMPFVAIGYVMGPQLKAFDSKGIIEGLSKTFLSAAFLPAIVGVPLSIGFILVNAGMSQNPPAALTMILNGSAGTGGSSGISDSFPLIAGVSDLWQLFWLFMTLGIMWVGVFAALEQQKITSSFTNGLKKGGEGLGKFALNVPLSIPFIPAPSKAGGGMMSFNKLRTKTRQLEGDAERGDLFDSSGDKSSSEHISKAIGELPEQSKKKFEGDLKITIRKDLKPQEKVDELRKIFTREYSNVPGYDSSIISAATDNKKFLDAIADQFPDLESELNKLESDARNYTPPATTPTPAAAPAATPAPTAPAAPAAPVTPPTPTTPAAPPLTPPTTPPTPRPATTP